MRPLLCAALALLAPSCGRFRRCEPVDPDALGALPERLSETGLYADIAADEIAPEVIAYEPRFHLWSDGAEKRRWIWLPPGETIDNGDPDDWRFPEGTRLWKEFTRGGTRVETRMIEKIGPEAEDWVGVAYRWDGSDAAASPEGEQDARGTDHDVPAAEECVACHGGRGSFVLGFSAVQLAGAPGYDLDQLAADGRLAQDPAPVALPGGERDQEALGYLHANCSHCHNPQRSVGTDDNPCYDPDSDVDLTLPSAGAGSVWDTPALRTAENKINPGKPDNSEILGRMSHRNVDSGFPTTMPPLATEEVDAAAVEMLTAWIESL